MSHLGDASCCTNDITNYNSPGERPLVDRDFAVRPSPRGCADQPRPRNAMSATDIVANLLHLSSEALDPGELLGAALEAVVDGAAVEAAAIAVARPPHWSVVAARGVAVGGGAVGAGGRSLGARRGGSSRRAGRPRRWPSRGHCWFAVRCPKPSSSPMARALGDALAIVAERHRASRRAERLEMILAITREWQRSDNMETLLMRMAEAATMMFDADRASIFLWDKANRTIVGRPALGVEGGELRLADDAGIVGPGDSDPASRGGWPASRTQPKSIARRTLKPVTAPTRFSACRSTRPTASGWVRSSS